MKVLPSISKILLVRPDMIGDAVLISPAISLIKKKLPKVKISLLLQKYTADLYENHPEVDEIILDQTPKNFFKFVGEIKKKRFDLAIAFYNELPYALLLLLAGIPIRIGDRSKILFGWMYNVKFSQRWSDLTRHEVEHNLELLTPLGIETNDPPPLKIATSQQIIELPKNKLLIGIHPGVGKGNKAWLPERYAEVIDRLGKKLEATLVLMGSKKEREIGLKITSLCQTPVLNLIEKTSLAQTMDLISKLHLFIGVDSGPLHIAAAYQIPTVAIFPTKFVKPIQWGPWQTPHLIVRKNIECQRICRPASCPFDDCLKQIEAQDVVEAVFALLEGKGKWSLESRKEWQKKSFQILTNEKTIYQKLTTSGYWAELSGKNNFINLFRQIVAKDINIIHWVGQKLNINLLMAKLISTFFLPIPPLLIWEKEKVERSPEKIISLYLEKFKTRKYF